MCRGPVPDILSKSDVEDRKGWKTSTLIHDEIIVSRDDPMMNINSNDVYRVQRLIEEELKEFELRHGWTKNTLEAKIEKL